MDRPDTTEIERVAQAQIEAGATTPHLSDAFELRHWQTLLTVTATTLLLLLAIAVVVRLLASISHTLLLFSLGGLLAYAMSPLVEAARRRPGGRVAARWTGVTVVFGGLFVLTVIAGLLFSRHLTHQLGLFATHRAEFTERAQAQIGSLEEWLAARGLHVNLTEYIHNPAGPVENLRGGAERGAAQIAERIGRGAVEGVIVLLITIYFLVFSEEMRRKFNESLPARLRPYAQQWQADVNRVLGGFVRGQTLLALIMGGMAAAACALLGVRLWLLIGIFVVFASLIPVFGPYIGAIPAAIAAAASPAGHFMSPIVRVIAVILLFVILNEVGSKILYPRLVGAALGLQEMLVLFVLFAGLEVAGVVGVLFAAPLVALASVTLVQLYRLWQGLPASAVAPPQARHIAEPPHSALSA